MNVTIVPEPCRRQFEYCHQRGPEADRRVRCGDLYRWSTRTDTELRICRMCIPLGEQLARAGSDTTGDEFGPSWEACLAWNLTLGALFAAAAEKAIDEALCIYGCGRTGYVHCGRRI